MLVVNDSMIKVIDNIDVLKTYSDRWEMLLQNDSSASVFQSFDFIQYAWESMYVNDSVLCILLYFTQSECDLQAIFPFYIDETSTLRFIYDNHTDFCDAIVSDPLKINYHFWDEVSSYILSDIGIKKVCLRNIRNNSPLCPYFRYFFHGAYEYAENSYSTLTIEQCVCGEHYSSHLQCLTGREKQKLRQISKKISYLNFRVFDSYSDQAVHVLNQIIDDMIVSRKRKSNYINQVLPVVLNLLYSDLASIFVTYCGDKAVALKVFLHNRNTAEYISWLMFYTDKKYNQYNIVQSLEYISKKGGIYNFARGVYGYKMEKFRPQIHNLYTLRWSRTVWGQIGDLFSLNLFQIKQIVKKIIKKL